MNGSTESVYCVGGMHSNCGKEQTMGLSYVKNLGQVGLLEKILDGGMPHIFPVDWKLVQ